MQQTRTAIALAFAEKYSSMALYLVSTIILARILSPADIGLYSVASGIVGISAMMRDFGIASYLIQEKDLTPQRFQSALGVASISAIVVILLLVGTAPLIADFYGRPSMRYAIYVLSSSFAFIPFNAVILAMLRREMNFASIYRMSVACAVANTVTSVGTAFLGAGFMCMAYGNLMGNVATACFAYRLRPRDYSLVPRLTEWRRMTGFGVYATATQALTEISVRAPDLIIGRFLGLTAVGLFSRANGLVTMVIEPLVRPVQSVALSAFSIANRTGGNLRAQYLHAMTLLTVVAWPAFVFLGLMAFPTIRIMFGDQWDAAVPLARYTCAGGAFLALTGLQMATFQAVGAIRRTLVATLITTPIQFGLLILACQYDFEKVALAAALMMMLTFFINQFLINRILGLGIGALGLASLRSLAVTAVSAVPPAAMLMLTRDAVATIWWELAGAAVLTPLFWLAGVVLLRHPIKAELLIVWRKLVPSRIRGAASGQP